MNEISSIKIFLVDDDAFFLRTLELDFQQYDNFIIETFESGERCVQSLGQKPDVIILDYHLDGIDKKAMNGIETLEIIKAYNADIPVIMLSAQDKIEVAVDCMHHKATDYVVKSETAFMRLQKIIANIGHMKKIEKELSWYMARM